MMKTINVGNRSFSMKSQRTFSPAQQGFDQNRLAKKYPKAMSALIILTLAHQPNPLKALMAVASGARSYDEKFIEKLLADAEKFIEQQNRPRRTFSEGDKITQKEYSEITSDEDFRKYAHTVMKNAHGSNYSEEFTNEIVDNLLKDHQDADYGELIGRLTSGLGE